MKTQFIHHSDSNRRLILIFAGWSTSPELYSKVSAEGWDILVAYDFSDDDLADSEGARECRRIAADYATVFIAAWSLGVIAAETVMGPAADSIAAAFAVNGTLRPVSDSEGIPETIFRGTEANLNLRNLLKFCKRMSSASDPYRYPAGNDISENFDIDLLRMELRNLGNLPFSNRLPWKRAYLSNNDRIFPYDSMLRAWRNHFPDIQIITLQCGHYYPMEKIIREITPDSQRIANRFREALPSYDSNASAQAEIIGNLLSMLPDSLKSKPLKVLEIGAGSGLLSKRLPEILQIESATFIDLFPLEKFNICSKETYLEGDAEILIDRMAENPDADKYDLIVSANTIQWFADPRTFFRNAARHLSPSGVLLCSTFLPGNLGELDSLRPAPLLYRDKDEIEKYLESIFGRYIIREQELTLRFESAHDMLHHLKSTGVGGGTRLAPGNLRQLIGSRQTAPTLTYRPLYIMAYGKE